MESVGIAQLMRVIEAVLGMEHSTQSIATYLMKALAGELNKENHKKDILYLIPYLQYLSSK